MPRTLLLPLLMRLPRLVVLPCTMLVVSLLHPRLGISARALTAHRLAQVLARAAAGYLLACSTLSPVKRRPWEALCPLRCPSLLGRRWLLQRRGPLRPKIARPPWSRLRRLHHLLSPHRQLPRQPSPLRLSAAQALALQLPLLPCLEVVPLRCFRARQALRLRCPLPSLACCTCRVAAGAFRLRHQHGKAAAGLRRGRC